LELRRARRRKKCRMHGPVKGRSKRGKREKERKKKATKIM
jgi:hypothetical protein